MSPSDVTHVAALGGGVIGQSWTALFLAAGKSVAVFDPDPVVERRVRNAVQAAWPVLTKLGLTDQGDPERLVFCENARAAVEGAQFVQESIPERIDLKSELYATIEPALGESTVVASSASGLTLTELQAGWRQPTRLVLGHPFNPPHLIPLVEVMGNQRTDPGVVDWTRTFYESIGKVTIEVKREVPGHVANRLQAALWRKPFTSSTREWRRCRTSTPRSPRDPASAGRRWVPPRSSTSAPVTVGWRPSVSATPTAQPMVGRSRATAPRPRSH